ncbi:unnamed protein product, partial [Meganyctiphanes norvegica]
NYKAMMYMLLVYVGFLLSCAFSEPSPDILHSGYVQNHRNENILPVKEEILCPDPDDIFPCVCSQHHEPDHNSTIDLDCSLIEDVDQLAKVFMADFPKKTFREFTVYNNSAINVLPSGIFHDVTFTSIGIMWGSLEMVEFGSFAGFEGFLEEMIFYQNNLQSIESFPFSELISFVMLNKLDLHGNHFKAMPEMENPALTYLDLRYNPIGWIPASSFMNLPSLKHIYLGETNMEEVKLGTFESLSQLRTIDLTNNKLSNITYGTIATTTDQLLWLDLARNNIQQINPNSITVQNEWLGLNLVSNELKELKETTFRPLLDQGSFLYVEDNPLLCGCDLAWLVRDTTLMDHIDQRATCATGVNLHDLDPQDFQDC